MNKALFLDRDGVINKNYGHVFRIDKIKFLRGIFELTKYFFDHGFYIFVVTNQAGISKGLYSIDEFKIVTRYINECFNQKGITISETFFCPHSAEDKCNCRKPNNGMIVEAINKYKIDPSKSFMIGDKESDLIACRKTEIAYCIKRTNSFSHERILKKIKKSIL